VAARLGTSWELAARNCKGLTHLVERQALTVEHSNKTEREGYLHWITAGATESPILNANVNRFKGLGRTVCHGLSLVLTIRDLADWELFGNNCASMN
jgi:hypothetical protein